MSDKSAAQALRFGFEVDILELGEATRDQAVAAQPLIREASPYHYTIPDFSVERET